MLTRLEAFISGMVFMMPGFTSPIHVIPEGIHQQWIQNSYVQQVFNRSANELELCTHRLERPAINQQFSVRLPTESPMGEIIHKDWQYFVIDFHESSYLSQLEVKPQEQVWSITNLYKATGSHCVQPLQSPWIHKPSYVM